MVFVDYRFSHYACAHVFLRQMRVVTCQTVRRSRAGIQIEEIISDGIVIDVELVRCHCGGGGRRCDLFFHMKLCRRERCRTARLASRGCLLGDGSRSWALALARRCKPAGMIDRESSPVIWTERRFAARWIGRCRWCPSLADEGRKKRDVLSVFLSLISMR